MWTSLAIVFLLWVPPSISVDVIPLPERFPGRTKWKAEESNPFASTRVIGGVPAPRDRYPYTVSLEKTSGAHICGGTLIDRMTVLSAAHCANSFSFVVIGRYNRTDTTEDYERFAVERKEIHPGYRDDDFPLDFLLIKLRGVSKYPPVKLNRNEQLPINGMELVVMGFGVTVPGHMSASEVLQEATVHYVPNEVCDESSDPDFVYDSYRGKISSDMLCASDVGEDSCQGDSGSPLILRGNDAEGDVQVGLVSWGFGCALEAFPGVYARVSHELGWIEGIACEFSDRESFMFECGREEKNTPTPSATPGNGEFVPVTVIIQLDANPEQTGWRIEDSAGNVIREAPPGTYSVASKMMEETVFLEGSRRHVFTAFDSAGDGFCCDQGAGYYQLIEGFAGGAQGDVLVFGNGFFNYEKIEEFTSPASFADPPAETPSPTQAPVVPGSAEKFPITVLLKFDAYPEEIGWRLERLSTEVDIVASVDPGTYASPHGSVMETIYLDPDGLYNFVIFDIFQDGMCCRYGDGMYQLFRGTTNTTDEGALVASDTGDFGGGREHTFVAHTEDKIDSNLNDTLTLELKLDNFPKEIGWILEGEIAESAVGRQYDASNLVVVDYALPGTYGSDFALQVVEETISIPRSPPGSSRMFVFTIFDSSEDGLCCEFGSGYFALFLGPSEDGEILATSSVESVPRESHSFFIEGVDPSENGGSSANGVRGHQVPFLVLAASLTYFSSW